MGSKSTSQRGQGGPTPSGGSSSSALAKSKDFKKAYYDLKANIAKKEKDGGGSDYVHKNLLSSDDYQLVPLTHLIPLLDATSRVIAAQSELRSVLRPPI